MTLSQHIIFSAPLGASIYALYGSPTLAAISMVTSVAIDMDHAIDYILENGEVNSFRRMIKSVFSGSGKKKLYCFFHSWELLSVLIIASSLFHNQTLDVITIGISYHMVCDQVYWTIIDKRLRPLAYFLFYRVQCNFDLATLTPTGRS